MRAGDQAAGDRRAERQGAAAATPFGERVTGEDWRDHDRRLAEALEDRDADPERRYDVRFVLVDAADCGVPQIRYRVFVAVFRRELGLVGWRLPPPTDSEAALWRDQASGRYWKHCRVPPRLGLTPLQLSVSDGTLPWRTLRDATGDLPEPLEAKLEHPGWPHHVTTWTGLPRPSRPASMA